MSAPRSATSMKRRSPGSALGSFQPQAAFAILAGAALGQGLFRIDVRAAVQVLVSQADDLPPLRLDDQAVVTKIALFQSTADLAELIGERVMRGEIEFRAVVNDEDFVFLGGSVKHGGTHAVHEGLVRDLVASAQSVQALQVLGRAQLLGQAAARVLTDLIDQRDDAFGTPPVAELRTAEHGFGKGLRSGSRDHQAPPCQGRFRRSQRWHPTRPRTGPCVVASLVEDTYPQGPLLHSRLTRYRPRLERHRFCKLYQRNLG